MALFHTPRAKRGYKEMDGKLIMLVVIVMVVIMVMFMGGKAMELKQICLIVGASKCLSLLVS